MLATRITVLSTTPSPRARTVGICLSAPQPSPHQDRFTRPGSAGKWEGPSVDEQADYKSASVKPAFFMISC
jgi:hypothetical protein